jgi:hypothetical protein
MRTAVSVAALAIILFGCRYAYGRERLSKTDLHAWYEDDSARFFDGKLPDAYVLWGNLQKDGWLGATSSESGYLEITLDHYDLTTDREARAVLRHEECHAATWGEEPAHGPEFQACTAHLKSLGIEVN